MPRLAAALLVGLTTLTAVVPAAIAAVVPGAEGPVPRRVAPASTTFAGAGHAAANRLTAGGAPCDKVHDDGARTPAPHEGLYGFIADCGQYLFERVVELLRAWSDPESGLVL